MPSDRPLVVPPPARLNADRIVAVGTALWFAAFLVLLPFWGWLGRHDHRIWLWTALAGGLLGLAGWLIMQRHRRMGRPV